MFSSVLLKVHGVLEASFGAAVIFATVLLFPFLEGLPLEVQYIAKMFGAALVAFGLTGILSVPSFATLFGAFVYHTSITALMVYQLIRNIPSDPAGCQGAAILHGTFSVLFALAVALSRKNKQNSTPSTKKSKKQ